MSREIKFRAWDKWQNRMLENITFADRRMPSNWERCFEMMQSTGLKDKNGVEIYEGDIVHYERHGGYMVESFTSPVIWLGESRLCWPAWGVDSKNNWDLFTAHELQNNVLDHLEVIGNIYENPELLEAK